MSDSIRSSVYIGYAKDDIFKPQFNTSSSDVVFYDELLTKWFIFRGVKCGVTIKTKKETYDENGMKTGVSNRPFIIYYNKKTKCYWASPLSSTYDPKLHPAIPNKYFWDVKNGNQSVELTNRHYRYIGADTDYFKGFFHKGQAFPCFSNCFTERNDSTSQKHNGKMESFFRKNCVENNVLDEYTSSNGLKPFYSPTDTQDYYYSPIYMHLMAFINYMNTSITSGNLYTNYISKISNGKKQSEDKKAEYQSDFLFSLKANLIGIKELQKDFINFTYTSKVYKKSRAELQFAGELIKREATKLNLSRKDLDAIAEKDMLEIEPKFHKLKNLLILRHDAINNIKIYGARLLNCTKISVKIEELITAITDDLLIDDLTKNPLDLAFFQNFHQLIGKVSSFSDLDALTAFDDINNMLEEIIMAHTNKFEDNQNRIQMQLEEQKRAKEQKQNETIVQELDEELLYNQRMEIASKNFERFIEDLRPSGGKHNVSIASSGLYDFENKLKQMKKVLSFFDSEDPIEKLGGFLYLDVSKYSREELVSMIEKLSEAFDTIKKEEALLNEIDNRFKNKISLDRFIAENPQYISLFLDENSGLELSCDILTFNEYQEHVSALTDDPAVKLCLETFPNFVADVVSKTDSQHSFYENAKDIFVDTLQLEVPEPEMEIVNRSFEQALKNNRFSNEDFETILIVGGECEKAFQNKSKKICIIRELLKEQSHLQEKCERLKAKYLNYTEDLDDNTMGIYNYYFTKNPDSYDIFHNIPNLKDIAKTLILSILNLDTTVDIPSVLEQSNDEDSRLNTYIQHLDKSNEYSSDKLSIFDVLYTIGSGCDDIGGICDSLCDNVSQNVIKAILEFSKTNSVVVDSTSAFVNVLIAKINQIVSNQKNINDNFPEDVAATFKKTCLLFPVNNEFGNDVLQKFIELAEKSGPIRNSLNTEFNDLNKSINDSFLYPNTNIVKRSVLTVLFDFANQVEVSIGPDNAVFPVADENGIIQNTSGDSDIAVFDDIWKFLELTARQINCMQKYLQSKSISSLIKTQIDTAFKNPRFRKILIDNEVKKELSIKTPTITQSQRQELLLLIERFIDGLIPELQNEKQKLLEYAIQKFNDEDKAFCEVMLSILKIENENKNNPEFASANYLLKKAFENKLASIEENNLNKPKKGE